MTELSNLPYAKSRTLPENSRISREGSRRRKVPLVYSSTTKMAPSGGGRRGVASSYDCTLRMWDLEGKQPPRILEGHTGAVTAVAISSDGQRAISGSGDNTVRGLGSWGSLPPRILEGHTSGVTAVPSLVTASALSPALATGRCVYGI